jgi:hypothetical protein
MKKNANFTWGPDQQCSYEKLKEALMTAPILKQADHHAGYILRTDGSGYALGIALFIKIMNNSLCLILPYSNSGKLFTALCKSG